jgi:uncharacterized protein
MQSPFFAAALAAVCWSTPYSLATAAPINCSAAKVDVEQAICAHPELLARDQAISVRIDTLKQQCPDSQKMLLTGQKFWLRERWDCRNVQGAFDTPDALASCLAAGMDRRLQQLGNIGKGCDLTSLAATYRFVDVDYLLRFSDRYVDKTVSVFGSMDLASCQDPRTSPTAATVVGKDRKRDRFRVEFSAMPAQEREHLCAERPASQWAGTIRHDSKGNYLFLTDVLGRKLPPS